MGRYLLRRLLWTPLVLFVLVTISFFLLRLAPGGPFSMEKEVTPEIRRNMEAKYHLDEPIRVQFGYYLRDLAAGDLGHSYKYKDRTVNEIIGHHFGKSAHLGLMAISLALAIGMTAGIVAAVRQNSIFDYASMTVAVIGIATPTFVTGTLSVLAFAIKLKWFDVSGWDDPKDFVLPTIVLALPFAARIARLMRAGMLEIVNQEYVKTARAKGLSERVVILRHALRGAVLPVVSFLGPGMADVLTGSLVVETIFGVPGIGSQFVQSATNRDYTVVMGMVLLYGALLVVFNLVADIAYGFLDPRIRYD